MSADPQPPTEPLPPSPDPASPQSAPPQPPARPQHRARPQTWPEQPTVPGQGVPWHGAAGQERYAIREQPPAQYQQQYAPGQQAQQWEPLPLPGQEMYRMTVAPKNPAVSVLLSVFIPGLGSMVNDNAGVGVAILILNIVGLILAVVLIGIPIAIGSWIWGLVDAYKSAQRWNRAHGIIS